MSPPLELHPLLSLATLVLCATLSVAGPWHYLFTSSCIKVMKSATVAPQKVTSKLILNSLHNHLYMWMSIRYNLGSIGLPDLTRRATKDENNINTG